MTLESSGKLWGTPLQDILKEGKRNSRINFCITLVDLIAVIVTSAILTKLDLSSFIILVAIAYALVSEFATSKLVNRAMIYAYRFYKKYKSKEIECYELNTTKGRGIGLPSRGMLSGLDLDDLIEVMLKECRLSKSDSRAFAKHILDVFKDKKVIVESEVDCTATFKFIKIRNTNYLVDAELVEL